MSTVSASAPAGVSSSSVAPREAPLQSLFDDIVADITALYGGTIGIAVAGANGVTMAGFDAPSPAWSTIKVPIAIAALRANPGLYADAQAALTVSDNDAAARLYDAAGPDAVNQVLAEMGVGAQVNTVLTRPGFSTFGQTMLTTGQEAVMAGQLACVPGAGDVVALMRQVDASQAYGLGTTGDAAYKGGWGPDEAGMYTTRQFGLMPRGDGTVAAVAITALPADGSYGAGQGMLNAAALALQEQAGLLPQTACS